MVLVAVLVGMAVGPNVAWAASSAWVRIKNWPSVMKVNVTSSVPVDHPARTSFQLDNSTNYLTNESDLFDPELTVPLNKWLVVTGASVEGSDNGTLKAMRLYTSGGSVSSSAYMMVSSPSSGIWQASMEHDILAAPGSTVGFEVVRSGTSATYHMCLNGYLTDKP
jgi:hypothetical protein